MQQEAIKCKINYWKNQIYKTARKNDLEPRNWDAQSQQKKGWKDDGGWVAANDSRS